MPPAAAVTATLTKPYSFPGDRRRSLRQPLAAFGTLIDETAADKTLQVTLVNISSTGVAFNAPVRVTFGASYKLRIGEGPLHLTSRLKIVDTRERGENAFEVAGKFV